MQQYLATIWRGLGDDTATDDELIAGARLEWSAMFAIDDNAGSIWTTESANLANLAKQLRVKLSEMGLQSIQFKTVQSHWMTGDYHEQLVIEFITPINRHLKADLQWDLEQAAKQVGLNVDPNPSHNNLRLMKNGVVPGVTGGAPAQPGTGDNYRPQKTDDPDKPSGWDKFLESLGLSTPFAVAGGVLLLIIITRR